jgi:transposase
VEAHPALFEKSRDESAFRHAAVEIAALRQQAAEGHIVLAYVDEAGFSAVHPNRSAWTPEGERHLIEAKRGKRLNVLAALLSSGGLFSAKLWQAATSELFVGFLGLLKEHVAKPLTVILDNASIHTAKRIRPFVDLLKKQGLTLYFLPTYSPELNRIEKLWHKAKHTWMAIKCRNAKTLETDVSHILDNFGSAYKLDF